MKKKNNTIKKNLNELNIGTIFFIVEDYCVGEIVVINGVKKIKEELSKQIFDIPNEPVEIILKDY